MKGRKAEYGEPKKPKSYGITPTAAKLLDELAKEMGLSASVLIEKIARRELHLKPCLGGILDQLIADAHDQLRKARECIVWYQNEFNDIEAKIQRLEELRTLDLDNEEQHA